MTEQIKTLMGQEAIDKWLEGRDAWNNWVEQNPGNDVDFSEVDFSQYRNYCGKIIKDQWPFSGFKFPNGGVSFKKATFGNGDVRFTGVTFGNGPTILSDVDFGDGLVSFSNVNFGGDCYFTMSIFGKGDVFFDYTTFKGRAFFSGTSLHEGAYIFKHIQFSKQASFLSLRNTDRVKAISFIGTVFDSSFNISSDEHFNCVPDFRSTKISDQFSLEGLKFKPLMAPKYPSFAPRPSSWFYKTRNWISEVTFKDANDAHRVRRLKAISETNKDHNKALEFKALEMQAMRYHHTFWPKLFWEFCFDIFSDYGRSAWRPAFGLFLIWILGAGLYTWLADTTCSCWEKFIAALAFSAGQMFLFIPSARDARSSWEGVLFNDQLPDYIYIATIPQNILALGLLFLLGLALRNQFRI